MLPCSPEPGREIGTPLSWRRIPDGPSLTRTDQCEWTPRQANPPRRYWCFISYRHADNKESGRQWATWLHQAIETYEVPADLVGKTNERGDTIPERIYPVFRDEEELPANAALSQPIREAVWNSRMLLVLCSPKALGSRFVHEEITIFKSCRPENKDRVLAAILAGDPAGPEEGDEVPYEQRQCFPLALRFAVDREGQVTDEPAEPVAPDFRLPDGSEGYTSPAAYREALLASGLNNRAELETRVRAYQERLEMMKLKIIAGILGVSYGDLSQRDKAYQIALERKRGQALGFIIDMFGEINPANAQGREITMREVLEKSSKSLGTSFEGNPTAELPIRRKLAEIYFKIGGYEQALAHAETMLKLAKAQHGESDHPDVSIALHNVGVYLNKLGRSEEALPQLQAALEMRQHLFPGDHPDVAESLNSMAYWLYRLGRSEEALPQLQAAVEMRQRLFPGDHPDVAESLNDAALCLQALGRSEEALPQLQAALEMRQRLFSGDHPDVAESLNNVALCLRDLGCSEEALPQFQAALEMHQRLFPGDHPDMADSLIGVAVCLQGLGRAEEALPQYQASLEMRQRLFPGDHPDVADSLVGVAVCLQALGRAEEALAQYQATLEMMQRLFPGDHSDVVLVLDNVAYCLQGLGRAGEALPQYQAALEMRQRLLSEDHVDIAVGHRNIADCYAALDQWEGAWEHHQIAKALLRSKDLEPVVVVVWVSEGSQAKKLGIHVNDVVVRHGVVPVVPVFTVSQFYRQCEDSKGFQVSLILERNGRTIKLKTEGGPLGVGLNIELRPLAPDDGGR